MRLASGAEQIARERRRQTDAEGYSYRHDDTHVNDELVLAAVCYALPYGKQAMDCLPGREVDVPVDWPWEDEAYKPDEDRVRELVKAGALIAAEIDRLIRDAGGVHS